MPRAEVARRLRRAAPTTTALLGLVGLLASPLMRAPIVAIGLISAALLLSVVSLSRRDAVTVLSTLLGALYLLPGGYVFVGPLKSVGNPAVLLGLLAFGLWAAARVLGLVPARVGHPVRWLAFGWAITSLVSLTAGTLRVLLPEESAGSTRQLFPLAAALGILLLAVDGLPTREAVHDVLFRLVVLVGLSALIGIAEFTVGLDFRSLMHLPGLTADIGGHVDTRAGFVRVQAAATHPIEYAVALGAVAPIAMHFALTQSQKSRRVISWLSLGAIVTVTPMTVSRSGLLGMTVAIVVYAVHLSPRARLNAAILGVLGLGLFRAAVPGLLGTLRDFVFAGSADSSITARTEDYAHIPQLIRGHELFGRGLGTFSPTSYFYVDNEYVLAYLEGGLLGALMLCALFVVGMGIARGYRKRSTLPDDRGLGQALAAAIACIAVSAGTFDEFSFRQTLFTFALLVGCAGALWGMARAREEATAVDAALRAVGPEDHRAAALAAPS